VNFSIYKSQIHGMISIDKYNSQPSYELMQKLCVAAVLMKMKSKEKVTNFIETKPD